MAGNMKEKEFDNINVEIAKIENEVDIILETIKGEISGTSDSGIKYVKIVFQYEIEVPRE